MALPCRLAAVLLWIIATAPAAEPRGLPPQPTAAAGEASNPRPLIGVLSQPLYHPLPNVSYVAASYAQLVESAGARAVAIPYTAPEAELRRRFEAVSGLILPGGTVGADASAAGRYDAVARTLYGWAVEESLAGRPFAVHGVCMGFQMLMRFSSTAGGAVLSRGFDSKEHPVPLAFTAEAEGSRLWGGGGDAAAVRARAASNPPVVVENHVEGVTPEALGADPALASTWRVLTTNVDRAGRELVSTVEAYDGRLLFSGTQWHPEKNPFEWKSAAVPHGPDAVRVSHLIATRLVDAARRSPHRPRSAEEEEALVIWNTAPRFRSPLVKDFELIFLYGPGGDDLVEE
mmetsp:Transcript_12421/g.43096  ORF Transcript_12421/g.43096 Transcript_12421/m.43096 type:complete len:345 (-) Transcript_12421:442-1476(-)